MKKVIIMLYSILIASIIFSFGCREKEEGIYKTGREWTYNVLFYSNDSVITDSCIVEMEITKKNFVSFLMSQKGVSYFYEIDGIKYHEKTGVKESEEGISLHQPRLGAFDFTEVLNMPTITYPLGVFITRKVKTEVTKSTFKPAESKVIMQEESQEKTENLLINGENLLWIC